MMADLVPQRSTMDQTNPLADALRRLANRSGLRLDRVALPPAFRPMLPGMITLMVGAVLFGVLGPGGVDRRLAGETLAVANQLSDEDEALRRELHPPAAATIATASGRPTDPQAFLAQVIAAASGAGLRITRLAPRPREAGLLDVEATADFPELLRFVTEAELLHGVFHGLRVHAPPSGDGPQGVAFELEAPPRMTAPGSQAAEARAAAADPRLGNPFAAPSQAADAPELHRLTGITQVGDTLMATIDGRDYRKGDRIGDMVVAAVAADAVSLAAGTRLLQLRFAQTAGSGPSPHP